MKRLRDWFREANKFGQITGALIGLGVVAAVMLAFAFSKWVAK